MFADFVPADGEGLTLGADLTVPGDYRPAALPAPSSETSVDGFDVSFDGELVAGTESELTVTVTRDGEPVTDLQPYLGALGHLVAIRNGDLAYLHVHPLDEADGSGGPQVRFAVEVPTAGTYGLYFDFAHGDEVRTASTIAAASRRPRPHRRTHRHLVGRARLARRLIGDERHSRAHRAGPGRRGRLGDRRDDLRVVRGADREAAQPARRRHGDGQLRHRAGQGARPGGGGVDELIAQVEAAGYTARPAATPPRHPDDATTPVTDEVDETRTLRTRLITSIVLSVPVIVLAMVQAWQFDYWQWLSLTLAAPVVTWGAWPFHRAAWLNLRHATATMDTLISIGVLAAFGWSLYALFLGDAGEPGMTHGFTWTADRDMGASLIYLEVAAGVTTFILAGRYFEARAKRRSGAALKALLELGAKDVAVLRDGAEQRVPIDAARRRRPLRRPPR